MNRASQSNTQGGSHIAKPSKPMQLPNNDERTRIVQISDLVTNVRRASTGCVPRTKARRQSGNAVEGVHEGSDVFKLSETVLERIDSIRLIRQYQDEEIEDVVKPQKEEPVSVQKIHRRKPRRMSGCAVESVNRDKPCLLLRLNSFDLNKKRMPARRASTHL